MMRSNRGLDCQLEVRAAGPLYEFVAYAASMPGLESLGWPCRPGEVMYDGQEIAVLHFAPARWLVDPSSTLASAMLAAAVEAGGGTAVHVEGKWRAMQLTGTHATRALASTVDIERLLRSRGCVATMAFDCPAIVVGASGGYRIWVSSSHAVDFAAALGRLN
jgi:sarcosine oxidase gamma subunit